MILSSEHLIQGSMVGVARQAKLLPARAEICADMRIPSLSSGSLRVVCATQ
jgi:hypothetical protein